MLRSLVGSEMCIRDRYQRRVRGFMPRSPWPGDNRAVECSGEWPERWSKKISDRHTGAWVPVLGAVVRAPHGTPRRRQPQPIPTIPPLPTPPPRVRRSRLTARTARKAEEMTTTSGERAMR
eukprot:TRINITY_DN1249_c0_g2_i16.p2 TRINITY_DN1249_c0_g2~~TRINITY_DN1249_c0_g2_i16.p2  ORF type:complete len:136 (+),score=42.76 TRINITY_DN1249_c0_g2_i16:46-408(+)